MPRGSLHKVLSQFITAPLYISQQDGLKLEVKKSESNKICPLLLRLNLDDSEFRVGKVFEVPFDTCCPSISELLEDYRCRECGLHHATKKSLSSHVKICTANFNNAASSAFQRQPACNTRFSSRPVRVAAKRQHEKMIIWTSGLGDSHIDWVDDDELVGVTSFIEDNDPLSGPDVPVVDIRSTIPVIWENV